MPVAKERVLATNSETTSLILTRPRTLSRSKFSSFNVPLLKTGCQMPVKSLLSGPKKKLESHLSKRGLTIGQLVWPD